MTNPSSDNETFTKVKASDQSGQPDAVSDEKPSSNSDTEKSVDINRTVKKSSEDDGKESASKSAKATKKTKSKKKAVVKKSATKKKAVNKADKKDVKKSATKKAKPKPVEPDLFDDYEEDSWSDDNDVGRGPNIMEGVGSLIGGVRSISTSAFRLAKEKTVDSAAKMIQQSPDQLERMAKAGRSLQDLRSVTGASIDEVANAIDLKNPDLLKAVEEGKAALPFEILLRLSSFYARNNPIPFILQYARTYNPLISNTLEKIGLDRLVITAEREIQFVQILRSRDAARELSDEDFKRVHAFTEKAFDMALNFAAGESDDEETE